MTVLSKDPTSPRRKWAVIAASTFLLLLSYIPIVYSFVAGIADEEDVEGGAGPLAFGLAMLPFAYLLLAFGSRHSRAPGAVIRAMGMFLLAGITGVVLTQSLIAGLVLGYGAGGVFALRAEDDHGYGMRFIFVGAAGLYVLFLNFVAPDAAFVAGAILPFLVLGLADYVSERRAARTPSDSGD